MKNQVRCLSGAADEIGFHVGVIDRNFNEKFTAEHGISSGALVQFVKMCGYWNDAINLVLSFNPKEHIFGYKPLGPRGIAIAIKSILQRKYGLWSYNKLEGTLRSITSKTKFDSYTGCPVWVGITDINSKYTNVRIDTLSYEEALEKVIQSSSVQILVNTLKGKGDGGLVNHIGSEFMAEYYPQCDVVSVFARTEKVCLKQPRISLKSIGWLIKNFLYLTSRNNETETDKICDKNGTNHIKIFMKKDVIEGMFTIKPEDNLELYEMGLSV